MKSEKSHLIHVVVNSIKAKLIASFIIPIILIIALGITSFLISSKGMRNTYESSTQTSLNMTMNYFNLVLHTISNKATQLQADDSVIEYFSTKYERKIDEYEKKNEISKRVSLATFSDDFISNIYMFSDEHYISSNSDLSDIYKEFIESQDAKEFLDTDENSKFIPIHNFLDNKTSTDSNEYALSYISNLSNNAYEKIGYVIIDLKSESVKKILSQLDLGENVISGFVVGENREILNEEAVGDFQFSSQSFYNDSVYSDKTIGYQYIEYKGQPYLYAYSKIPDTNMMLCSLIPESTILKQSANVKKVTVGIVIFACLIAILIGTFISSGISGTIQSMNTSLVRVGNGDLTVEITTKRKDEFNTLTKSISNMITNMKNMIHGMTNISNTVFNSAKEVSDNSEVLLSATQDIALAVGDIEQGILQQSSDAENCLHQMEDLATQINNVYQNTIEIESTAQKTKDIIGEGIVLIGDLNRKAKDTSDITKNIIEDIENLKNDSKHIRSIIETINEISSQSNLLSLNATIEASRAGIAGKGFAVVANEIGKLADQSSKSACQIEEIIMQMQMRTDKTVITARQAESIVNSQEQALFKTVNAFEKISQQVESLWRNINSVSNGITCIEQAKDDTLGAIESISATSEETAAASTNLSNTAENQLKAVEVLTKVAVSLKEDAVNLNETVKIFKIQS